MRLASTSITAGKNITSLVAITIASFMLRQDGRAAAATLLNHGALVVAATMVVAANTAAVIANSSRFLDRWIACDLSLHASYQ